VASLGSWLSFYDLDVSDDKDDNLIPAISATDAGGAVSVCSSYADDTNVHTLLVLLTFSAHRGLLQLTSLCYVWGRLRGGTGFKAHRAARPPLPFPSPSPIPPPASGRPVRDSRVSMGHSADLPSSFMKVVIPGLHTLGPADYGFKNLTSAPAGERAYSFRFCQVVPSPRVPLLGCTRATTPKPYTFSTPSPKGGLPIVTMFWLPPARVTLWMGRKAPPSVV
jgi:hypothetical protein